MNLLIIMSDEHRRDAMGCMGHARVRTPHLDALAAGGTVFDNACTPSPMCVPARAALACGDHVHRIGYWDSTHPYDGGRRSWMHMIRDQGAEVVSFGKLHFRCDQDDNGFSEEILPMHVVNGVGWPIGLLRKPPVTYENACELASGVGRGESSYTHYDRAITVAAERWLTARKGKTEPWAAFVSFVSPHYPLRAPAKFYDLYDPRPLESPTDGPAHTTLHPELARVQKFFNYDDYFDAQTRGRARAAYFGLCSFMDDCVGRVLHALEAGGQADDTMILYLSDHGEMLGEQGFWTKQIMYEASVGVPLILSGPGLPKGRRQATPTSLLDIHATALEAFGLLADEALPGQSLCGLARLPVDPDRTVFSEYHDGGSTTGTFMVRWDRWKFVYYVGEAPQLFNLTTDPRELNCLARDPGCASILAEGERRLRGICDPEAINTRCFSDQARRIAILGGEQACREATTFNHTPVPAIR